MRLHDLSLGGFGRLTDATFSFRPGLNFIIGPNEAGKSTLLTAIFTLLYGFFDSGSINSSRRDLLDAYRPWRAGAAYRGWLTFSLQSGQEYRVERSFGPRMATTLSLQPKGDDVSAQFRSESSGRLYFADDLLGMSRTVFENTVCLRQSELARLDKPASAISEAITRLTTSGSGDASARAAIDLLKLALRDEIGTARAWTKPLAVAQKELGNLAQSQEREIRRQEQLWSLTREFNQYEARSALLKAQKERLAYLKLLVEQAERRATLVHIDEAQREVERHRADTAAWARYADVAVHLRDELQRQYGEWQRQGAQVAQAAAYRKTLEAQLGELQARSEQAARQLAGPSHTLQPLPAIRDRIVAVHAQWVRAGEDRDQARQALAAAQEQTARLGRQMDGERVTNRALMAAGASGLAKLQSAWEEASRALEEAEERYGRAFEAWGQVGMSEAEYGAMIQRAEAVRAGESPARVQRGCNPFRRAAPPDAGPPVEVTIADDLIPIHAALEAASAARDGARARYREAEDKVRSVLALEAVQPVTEELLCAGSERLGELDRLAMRVQVLEAARAEAGKRADGAEAGLAAVAARLRQELIEQGISVDDPAAGVAAYLSAFDRQVARANAAAESEKLQQQQASILAQIEQSRQLQDEWVATEQRIDDLLAAGGVEAIGAQSIEQRVAAFRLLCDRHEQWSAANQELHAAQQRLDLLEKISQEQGIVHQIEVAERQLQTLLQAQPAWTGLAPDQTRADYERLLSEAAGEMQQAEHEIVRLHMQKNMLEGQAESLAALHEQQAMAADQVRRLTRAGDILTKSTELLQDAVIEFQKAFAPRLEAQITQGLSKVTGSRYHKVRLNPADLALDVWAPEAGDWVATERLSTGTRDLVYIVMRAAISDLLGGDNESLPLLLDDPFVHLDSQREQQSLAYLAQVAQDRQVLCFSKDSSLPARVGDGSHDYPVMHLM